MVNLNQMLNPKKVLTIVVSQYLSNWHSHIYAYAYIKYVCLVCVYIYIYIYIHTNPSNLHVVFALF